MSSVFLIVLTLTAGTAFLMWLGEEITAKGVGNGISLLIMAGIVAGLPSATYTTVEAAFVTQNNSFGPVNLLVLLGIMLAIVAAIVTSAGNAASRSSTPGERSVADGQLDASR